MLRAVNQIVTSKVAATRTTTDPTSIQTRQAAQRSASVIAVLPGRAAVEVITSITRTIAPPEPILLARRSAGLLGSHVLPHAVEELDRPVGRGLRLDVGPPARHLLRHVPAVLPVGLSVGPPSQPSDDGAHTSGREGRDDGTGWRLVERAELVGEAGHRTTDADTAGPHAATHVVDGAPHHDVAVDDRAPATDLDEALRIAIVLGKDPFLVKPGPRAALMDGVTEEPRRPAELVEGRQRTEPLEEQQNREHRLGEVVPLWCAPRDVDNRQAERAPVVLAKRIHDTHRAGRITLGGRDTAPRGAGPDGNRPCRPRRESVQPCRSWHGP